MPYFLLDLYGKPTMQRDAMDRLNQVFEGWDNADASEGDSTKDAKGGDGST
jgi:hypothetical protein